MDVSDRIPKLREANQRYAMLPLLRQAKLVGRLSVAAADAQLVELLEPCYSANTGHSCHHGTIDNAISGDLLVHLDHAALKDLSIWEVGKRLMILKSIYQLKMSYGISLEAGDYVPPSKTMGRSIGNRNKKSTLVIASSMGQKEEASIGAAGALLSMLTNWLLSLLLQPPVPWSLCVSSCSALHYIRRCVRERKLALFERDMAALIYLRTFGLRLHA